MSESRPPLADAGPPAGADSLVRRSFGPNAAKYVSSPSHANPADLQRIVDQVKPAGGRLLDLACGAGHCGLAFAPHVDAVVLADLTPEMLEVAAGQAAERGLTNVTTQEVDVSALPFADGSFDHVSCRIAAHHFPDQPGALREMQRVLRPGGTLIFIDNVVPEDPAAAGLINEFEIIRDPSHAVCYSEPGLKGIVEQAGFVVTEATQRRKRMDLLNWTERLNVSAADLDRLIGILDSSTGDARASLNPREEAGRRVFDLVELTIIARKPEQTA